MAERRKYSRIRAKFPCELRLGESSTKATVRDLSEGGLSILGDFDEPDQGEPVRITLLPPAHGDVEVACVFWHGRRIRVVGEERWTANLGFVLSRACDPYFALVEELRDRAMLPTPVIRPIDKVAPKNPHEVGALAPAGVPVLRQFSVWVKQEGGPRTIRIVVAARDDKDAIERALAEAGCEWVALEAKRV